MDQVNRRQQNELDRMKRLNAESFWDAVDVTFAEWQAQKPVRKPKPTQQQQSQTGTRA